MLVSDSECSQNRRIFAFFAVTAILTTLTPLVPLFVAALGFFVLPATRIWQYLCGYTFIFGMSIVYASRGFGISPFDDFANVYYPLYLDISSVGLYAAHFARFDGFSISSLEFGFPLLLFFLSLIEPEAPSSALVWVVTFLGGGAYLFWLITYVVKAVPKDHANILIVLSLGFFAFGLCSQLTRQMFSLPFLLIAISERSLKRSLTALFVGGAFHIAVFPVYFLALSVRKFPIITVVSVCISGGLIYHLSDILLHSLLGLDVGAFDKLSYYTSGNLDAASFSAELITLPIIWMCLLIMGKRNDLVVPANLVVTMAVIYISLLNIPLLSFRLTLVVSAALMGPMLYLLLARLRPHSVLVSLSVLAVCANQFRRWVLYDTESGMGLWVAYPQADIFPLYFVFN